MNKLVVKLVILATVAALPAAVFAHSNYGPRSGLLYRISGKGLKKPSYLFGTIHLVCPDQMIAIEKFTPYLAKTEQLVTELDLSDVSQMTGVAAKMMAGSAPRTGTLLTPEQFDKVAKLIKEDLGLGPEVVRLMPPQMLQLMLMTSPKVIGCVSPASYDLSLTNEAKKRRIPVVGLETADMQMAFLSGQTAASQSKMLIDAADDPQKLAANYRLLMEAYKKQDSDQLYEAMAKQQAGEDAALYDRLLRQRNEAWAPQLVELTTKKPSFIAVGGGHLGGKNGLIELLKSLGYKLTAIRL